MRQYIIEQSEQIAYALLRISAYIRRFDLRKRIENLAYHLIENTAYGNNELSLSTIEAIAGFIRLAKHVYEIEPVNSKIIIQELDELNKAIRQEYGMNELPHLEGFFSRDKSIPKEIKKEKREVIVSSGSRSNEILTLISKAESGKLQLKDIIAGFPGVSERTLRYDLQKLCDEGKLVREGSGGPSNFYTLPDSTSVINQV